MMEHEPHPEQHIGDTSEAHHEHKKSWYSLTSPRSSLGSHPDTHSSTVVSQLPDFDDAFDDSDHIPGQSTLTQNPLKRESTGATVDVRQVLGDDWAGIQGYEKPEEGEGVVQEIGALPMQMVEVSLNDGPVLPLDDQPRRLPEIKTETYYDEHVQPPSPTAPGIVISRPHNPDSDSEAGEDEPASAHSAPERFDDVSLANDTRSATTSPRAPVPIRIVVPPSPMSSQVQVVQSPQHPSERNLSPPSGRLSPRSPTNQSSTSVATTESRKTASMTSSTSLPHSMGSPRATSPTSTTPATPRSAGRPRRHTGISTQDVVSKTRPTYLPPKSKEEDRKHMKAWEEMMQRSREADEQRKQKLLERRLAREQAVESSVGQWEREVMPDIKAAMRDPKLRSLWWKGIPTKLRGKVWHTTLGNALALSKDAYRSCLQRAKRAISSNSFPADVMSQIEEDIVGTLPALHLFHPQTGPMYQDLKDLLCAWVVSRADEGLTYVRGASTVGAMFLINMSAEQAFVAMRNMLERHCMRSFYGGISSKEDVEAYYRIFDTLLADVMPKVYFNFKQHTISPSMYLRDWLITIFLQHLPFEACSRIWDVLILEGDSFLFRTALSILGVMESRLFFPDRKELLEVLYGENKAAIEVARRTESVIVDLGARYEQYGMTEEALWERLEQTEWKDSTWSRLIQRELPDL